MDLPVARNGSRDEGKDPVVFIQEQEVVAGFRKFYPVPMDGIELDGLRFEVINVLLIDEFLILKALRRNFQLLSQQQSEYDIKRTG